MNKKVLKIDIHGMERQAAKHKLENLIRTAPKDVGEIVVVHGYNSGTALLEMVRGELRHSRISDKMISVVNPGITTLFLRD
ncbi:MAG: Smr/MutS family protein [Oscillospiraceae bacterium]|nr:Smr/MutS family protein [Oscillospiraceae bacterium]